jgi:copper chaperone CopZ
MKTRLTGMALVALLVALPATVLRAQDATQPSRIAWSIANVQGAPDVDKISTALKGLKGVTSVSDLTPDSKRAVIGYMPAQVSAQQIAQAIADAAGGQGGGYQASMLVRVTNLSDNATQEKATTALKGVQGVASAAAMDANAGILAIQFAPLPDADKSGGPKGASEAQILKALRDAGLTAQTVTSAASA